VGATFLTHTVEPLLSRRDGFDVTSDKIWGRYRQLSLGGPGYHAIYKQRSQINRVYSNKWRACFVIRHRSNTVKRH